MDELPQQKFTVEELLSPWTRPGVGGRDVLCLPPIGNPQARLMLILSHPTFSDVKKKTLLAEEYGTEVFGACQEAGIKPEEIYVTSLIKHGIGKQPKPTSEQIAEATPRLEQEIELVKPALIMTLGAEVFKWAMKSNMKQGNYLGEIIDSPRGKLLPNFSPGMILTQDPKKRVEFRAAFRLAARFLAGPIEYTPFTWEVVTSPDRNIDILLDYMNRGLWTIGYDAEWTPGKLANAEPVMTSFQYSCEPNHAIILDISSDLKTENMELLNTMKLMLCHEKADRVGWNVRADDKHLIARGIVPLESTLGFDGMKAVAFFDSRFPKGLETGIRYFTNYAPYYLALTDALRKHKLAAQDLAQLKLLEPETYWQYCAGDGVSHLTACTNMRNAMNTHCKPHVRDYYFSTYLPLSNYFIDLEMHGVPIDVEVLADLSDKYSSKFRELRAGLMELVLPLMPEFNPASAPAKKELLYKHLRLDPPYYTKSGKSPKPRVWYAKQKKDVQEQYQPSTNNKSLSTLRFELIERLENKELGEEQRQHFEFCLRVISLLLNMNRVGVFANKFLDRRGTGYQPVEAPVAAVDAVVTPDGSATPPAPIVEALEEDEEDEPLKQSYWGALCNDNRIHADFFECLNNFRSSSKPNVQNPASKVLSHIPDIFVPGYASLSKEDRKKYEHLVPRNIRHIFYSGNKDFLFAEADVAGADLQIAAFLSKDPDYIQDMLQGGFHLTKAREYFKDPSISKDDYSKYVSAKSITFRVAYTSELLTAAIPIQSEIFAESGILVKLEDIEYALTTWKRYAKYMEYREACKRQATEEHYIENARGMRYMFDTTDKFGILAGWQNESLAFPIASELALFMWDIAVSMKRQLQQDGLWMKTIIPVNTVHDASYWIVHKDLLKDNYFPEVVKYFFTSYCKMATGDTLGMEMVMGDRWKAEKSQVAFHNETKWDFVTKTWNWKN